MVTFIPLPLSTQGTSPQAQGLARSLQGQLGDLHGLVRRAVTNVERSGVQQPAHTLAGRLEQARRWLQTPDGPDRELGQRAIQLVVEQVHSRWCDRKSCIVNRRR